MDSTHFWRRSRGSGHVCLHRLFSSSPRTHGILAPLSVSIDVRMHDCSAKSLPIRSPHLPKLGNDLKVIQLISICAAVDGLDLEERILFVEFDRNVGPSSNEHL